MLDDFEVGDNEMKFFCPNLTFLAEVHKWRTNHVTFPTWLCNVCGWASARWEFVVKNCLIKKNI